MTPILPNFDTTRAVRQLMTGLDTSRLVRGVTASNLATGRMLREVTDTSRLVRGVTASSLVTGRMLREVTATGFDTSRLVREVAATGFDTSRLVREAFPRFDSTQMMREAFKVFEARHLQRAFATARDLLEAQDLGGDEPTPISAAQAGATSARPPLFPGLADPWGQIRNMQLKDWIPIWIGIVGLILAWMALHPGPSLGPQEIEQLVRRVQEGLQTPGPATTTTRPATTTTVPPATTTPPPSSAPPTTGP
jgi:hypothetical protein